MCVCVGVCVYIYMCVCVCARLCVCFYVTTPPHAGTIMDQSSGSCSLIARLRCKAPLGNPEPETRSLKSQTLRDRGKSRFSGLGPQKH